MIRSKQTPFQPHQALPFRVRHARKAHAGKHTLGPFHTYHVAQNKENGREVRGATLQTLVKPSSHPLSPKPWWMLTRHISAGEMRHSCCPPRSYR